ncbi:LADA_0C00914g1_1 [Lachancea dasiensis]|uniref:LADA_0C00914g1_1 n=1 Tax=Lachancea dasiensis TaxID=1072105 RepID=A0A1G4IXW7_9SACH|nr:LADA_0C00914g1_1 [Lachancea dasiensis]
MSFGSRNKTPCKYFQQGRCKKGNACNFAHVYTGNNNNNGNTNANDSGGANRYQSFVNASNLGKYANEVNDDLTGASEFMFQPLSSSYGLGSPCAVNLITGRDFSPEEARFLFYQSQMHNSVPTYEVQMKARASDFEQSRKYILADTRKAARYLQLATQKAHESGAAPSKGYLEHGLDLTGASYANAGPNPRTSNLFGANTTPNAFGQTMNSTKPGPFGSSNAFGSGSANTFGSGSSGAFGSSTGAFGTPAFASSNTTTAFGQPTFGAAPNTATSPFGGSSAFGGKPPSTGFGPGGSTSFGSPAASASTSAFGKPTFGSSGGSNASAFGQPAFRTAPSGSQTSPFGQGGSTSNTQTTSNAGAPSAFGQPTFGSTSTSSPFASIQGGSSPFGSGTNPAVTGSSSTPFGSTFQKPVNNTNNGTPFGAASPFGSAGFVPANAQNPQPNAQTMQHPFGSSISNNPIGTNTQPSSTSLGIPQKTTQSFIQGLPEESTLSESDLPKEVVDYFKADNFTIGKVPDIPPPSTLVN